MCTVSSFGLRNWKGAVTDVLVRLIGQNAVSSLSLEGFGTRFGSVATFGKLLNISSEATKLTARLEDCLKRYTGGDLFTTDRKNQSMLQWKPTARSMIATNARPSVEDESDGFWRRMMVLPFRIQISRNEQNPNLASELVEEEIAGVFEWALEGLKRLHEQNGFTVPAISKQAQEEYRLESSPVKQFVSEHCVLDPRRRIETTALYVDYVKWAEANGEELLTATQFGIRLGKAHRSVTKVRVRNAGRLVYVYQGVALIEAGTAASRLPFRRGAA
jgi:putative DNA primase/helicase